MKKLLGIAAGAGMLLAVAVPALAYTRPLLKANVNVALVKNTSDSTSVTGQNIQGNGVYVERAGVDEVEVSGQNTMYTGAADARSGSVVVANTTVRCWTCNRSSALISVNGDLAVVKNKSTAMSITGNNDQGNGATIKMADADDVEVEGNNVMGTGTATTRSGAITLVNTHWNR